MSWNQSWYDIEASVGEIDSAALIDDHDTWKVDISRRLLTVLKLQKPYLIHCMICSLLAMSAFLSTVLGLVCSRGDPGTWHAIIEGGSWQTMCWVAVALALCIEVAARVLIQGTSSFTRDRWACLDVALLLLTAIAWKVTHLRYISPNKKRDMEEVGGADLILLAIRFALQLGRVLSACSMTRQVHEMQQNDIDIPDVMRTV